MGTRYNYDNGIVCKNPNCRSFGRPHPNCKCGGGGLGAVAGRFVERAASHFGSMAQGEGYAHGGEVHHCLTGMPHMESCEHFAKGGGVHENQQFASDPAMALDHMILEKGLHHALTKTGHSKAKHQGAEFLEHANAGRKKLDNHAKNLLNPDAEPITANADETKALGDHLDSLQMNPSSALAVGGSLGDSFPDHQLHLAEKLARASNYFDSIKPFANHGAPLDKIMPPSQKEKAHYARQLAIAQNPALVYQKAKEAMLQPSDIDTLQAIYPKLHQAMVNKAGDAVVDHKAQGLELPKHAKHGLSVLMQQNLSFIQTPLAMQAIMQANAPEHPAAAPGKPAARARNKAVDESNKQAQLEATSDQKRLLEKTR